MAVGTPTFPATGVAVPNGTGQWVTATFTGGTTQCTAVTPPSLPLPPVTPAIPAVSATQQVNSNAFPVLVQIAGGTVTVVAVNGVTVATSSPATVVVPAGGNIAITWSVIPTSWTWSAVYSGLCGNPITAPFYVTVPPGGGITAYFSAAATWAWTDYDFVQDTPFYAAENVGAEAAGYNPATAMPLAQHAVGGLTNFGTGVTN